MRVFPLARRHSPGLKSASMSNRSRRPLTTSVRTEPFDGAQGRPVEGRSRGFDKLSPNGFKLSLNGFKRSPNGFFANNAHPRADGTGDARPMGCCQGDRR